MSDYSTVKIVWLVIRTSAVLAVGLIVGCASPQKKLDPDQYVFTFISEPSGALIYYADGTAIGTTPYQSIFRVPPQFVGQTKIQTKMYAVWASGARADVTNTWSPASNKRWTFKFDRPASAANLDVDLRQAVAQESILFQRRAEAIKKREAAAADNREAAKAFLDGIAAGQRRRSTSCTVLGGPGAAIVSCD